MNNYIVLAAALLMPPSLLAAETIHQTSWALIEGPDQLVWSAISDASMINLGNEYYDDYRFESVSVSVSDASHTEVGAFTVDLTNSGANSFQVYGPITQHLFDDDDQYEVAVEIHIPGNADNGYQGRTITRVYSADLATGQGKLVFEAEGQGMLVSAPGDERFILTRNTGPSLLDDTVIDIYQRADGAQEASVAHTFTISRSLTEYLCSSCFLPVVLDDGIHFIVSHYEKPLPVIDQNGEQQYNPITWLPDWTPDNYFVIEHYDASYQQIDDVWTSTALPEGMYARMMGIGASSAHDFTRGYFTGDQRYNYVIMYEDMNEDWENEYAFDVYVEGGERLGNLCSHVGGFWNELAPIPGEANQWIFLQSNAETGEQQLALVDASTLKVVQNVPAFLDDHMISSNFDRIADPVEGYKYVIGLNEPSSDDDFNVIAHYGIYHRDLTADRYLSFNMGPNAETFSPLVNYQSLDPHLFCSDDKHEFIFLAKIKNNDGSLSNALFLGNEDNKILKTWGREDDKEIQQVTIVNYGSDQPELFISYVSQETGTYTFKFEKLPFSDLEGIHSVKADRMSPRLYNLLGQPIAQPAYGLHIQNGRLIGNSKR